MRILHWKKEADIEEGGRNGTESEKNNRKKLEQTLPVLAYRTAFIRAYACGTLLHQLVPAE